MNAGRNQLAAELMVWIDHYGFESGGDAQGVADELLGSEWLRAVKAEAWDEGHRCGFSDAQDAARHIIHGEHNPYREGDDQ